MSIPEPPKGHTRPIVFFDVAIGDTKLPRIKMELFDDIVPKSVVVPRPFSFFSCCVR